MHPPSPSGVIFGTQHQGEFFFASGRGIRAAMGRKAKGQQRPEAVDPLPAQRGEAARPPSGKVIGFYSDKAGKYCEFSNFYSRAPPFQFARPECARAPGFPEVVTCEFSEKAIMLTKAALMGDLDIFRAIAAASQPVKAKALGRRVHPWDQGRWDKHLEEVAFEVVRQKFAANRELREVLLSTGTATIAEATRNDRIWGIGLNVGEAGVNDPRQWRGRNVLGFALMRVRELLQRGDDATAARTCSSSSKRPSSSHSSISRTACSTCLPRWPLPC